jgi:hypothetical protein
LELEQVQQEAGSEGIEGGTATDTEQAQAQEILNLDSVEKFRFDNKEWTPKDLRSAYLMQSDYTKKTQEIAQERKFYDNLEFDLHQVKNNPSLAAQFKSIYPEKFHKFLGYVSQGSSAGQATAQTQTEQKSQYAQIDPSLVERFNRLESSIHEQKVQAAEADLNEKCAKYSKEFPFADEEAVLARASALLDRGTKLTDQVWEGLWKSVHERNEKIASQFYSQKVNQQKTMNSKGKDIARGGGTPAQAPRVAKTIREASQFALQELENS